MYYQSGTMRDLHPQPPSPKKSSVIWDRENEFQYAQRSKYQKSELSHLLVPKSKSPAYESPQSPPPPKPTQSNQISVTLPIKIKSTEREDYMNTFKIQLLAIHQKNNNCLTMHMTNDQDSESEFLNLKNQQSLKVDFHGFPELVLEHLNYCSNYDKQSQSSPQPPKNPIFYSVLDIKKGNEQAQLKIIEANKYKQSLHLSLKFKKANDEQVKLYLSQKYDRQRKENKELTNQLHQAHHKLNLRMQELERKCVEFQDMEREKNQRIGELERREREKIKEMRLGIQEENMRKQKYQTERTTKQVNDLNTKIQQLKQKNEQLQSTLQKSTQKTINLESTESTLRSKCTILQQQNDSYEKTNKQLKLKQLKHNEQYHALRNQNTRLTCMIESLEDKIKEKDQRLSQNSQVKSNHYSQISGLEESLRQEKAKVGKLEEKNQGMEAEIAKLQKKNQDLFNKYQKKKDKLVDYKQIISMQQQKIQKYQREQRKMLEQIVQLKRDLESSDREIKDKQIKIKDLKGHIEQIQYQLQGKMKMIQDLNRRINQKSIGVKNIPMPSSLPVYTGLVGTSTLGRDYSSTLSSTSQSRLKYSPSPISTSPLQKTNERIAPPFRKYREGVQNDKDQQNSHHSNNSHSRSPIVNKLNQQLDPEDADKTREKIGPIKFKK